MFSTDGNPVRIVVETVPHDVVKRLEAEDEYLKGRLSATNNRMVEIMDVVGELRREISRLQQNCANCESACAPTRSLLGRRKI